MKWPFRKDSSSPQCKNGSGFRDGMEHMALDMLDALPFLAIVVDSQGGIRYLNSPVTRLLGWSTSELSNASITSMVAPPDHASLLAHLGAAERGNASGGHRSHAEFPLSMLRKDGAEVYGRFSVRPIRFQLIACVLLCVRIPVMEDLELRVAREEMLKFKRSSENKSRFLANTSHEIRTLLNGILGMIDLLASSQLDATQRSYLTSLKSSSRNLRALLNDVLDLSKIEEGLIELENRSFDMVETVKVAVDALHATAVAKGLFLTFTNDLPQRVFIGDSLRLSQIISNLIDNALKFTHQGGVTVRLSGYLEDMDRDLWALRLWVKDTGMGIAIENQEHLFNSYYQAGSAIARKYGGSGLGLNLSKQLVELMGGSIHFVSQSGAGSEFELRVTLCATFERPTFMDTLPPRGLESLNGARILIVDDDLTSQALVAAWLSKEGVATVIRSTGREAVEHVMSGERLDAVLMDVSMPDMDGLAATRRIRQVAVSQLGDRSRYMAALPIIGISGHASEQDRARCFSAGMTGYMTKPLSRTVVLEQLKLVLSEDFRHQS